MLILLVNINQMNCQQVTDGVWWERAVASGYYQTGQIPQLGSVICFYDNNGGSGHVAIVEEIDSQTGQITCSNSAWQSTFFFLTTISPDNNGRYNWSHYTFQGFIYNPYADQPTPSPTFKRGKFPWVIFTNKIKQRRIL